MSEGGRDLLNPIEDALGTPLRRKPEGSLGGDLELMTPMLAGGGREKQRPVIWSVTRRAPPTVALGRSNPLGSAKLNRA
jgi:hypothetical protein